MDVCEFMDVLIKSQVRQEVMGHIEKREETSIPGGDRRE
jgi:hypothetical protein